MAAVPSHHFQFSMRHYSFLFTHLGSYASEWKNLGIALRFQPQDLNNIESSLVLLPESPKSFMRKLLEEWLQGSYPYLSSPTLGVLLDALNSQIVGLGALGERIKGELPQIDPISRYEFEIASISEKGEVLFQRNEDIVVEENTSVSLKVTTSLTNFRWFQEGLVPLDDKMYQNVKTNTLSIFKPGVDVDGSKFSCEVKNIKNEILCQTRPVTLRVSSPQVDKFKESLNPLYLAKSEVPEESWLPVSTSTYIALMLIKQKTTNLGGENLRPTFQGPIDGTLRNKESIRYKDIFDGLRGGHLLIIEGRPGCGKTTLLHKISRDWASAELQGPRRLMLLVPLRVFNNRMKPICLGDVLQEVDLVEVEQVLKERKGKGFCFIFDGLDEFSPYEGKQSLIYKIINKEYLPLSTVIVASRPAALIKLRKKADKIVEVVGFTKDQIYKYIEQYPFSSRSKVEELKLYFDNHPNIMHLCYLPIHAAMVSFIFEVIGKVPQTETEIYKLMTLYSLMRSITKHCDEDLDNMSFESLNEDQKVGLQNVCRLAFKATLNHKQVLDEEEIEVHLGGKGNKDVTFGLLTVDRAVGLKGYKNQYSFLHLTYQEYLAAHYISSLSHFDQHQLIVDYKGNEHMEVVWKFYCGLTKIEEYGYQIKELFSTRSRLLLPHILCAYESHQKSFCDFLIKHANGEININNKYLTRADLTALGFFLATITKEVSLTLSRCNIDNQRIKILKSELKGNILLHSLQYESEEVVLDGINVLLTNQCGVKILKLRKIVAENVRASSQNLPNISVSLDDFGFSNLFTTSLASLEHLEIDRINVGSMTLYNALQYCKNLKSLVLNHAIEEHEITILLGGILQCDMLETLTCKNNKILIDISCDPALQFDRLFVRGIRRNGKHQTLRISGIITEEFVKLSCTYFNSLQVLQLYVPNCEIVQAISSIIDFDLVALTKLGFCDMHIGETEAEELAAKLSHCHLLQEIHFGGVEISKDGIKHILTSLKNCTDLRSIVLNGTCIESKAQVLASCLQHWRKLEQLHLRECDIEEEGAMSILDSLERNNFDKLEEVELIGNSITPETIRMILSSVKSRSTHKKRSIRRKRGKLECIIS